MEELEALRGIYGDDVVWVREEEPRAILVRAGRYEYLAEFCAGYPTERAPRLTVRDTEYTADTKELRRLADDVAGDFVAGEVFCFAAFLRVGELLESGEYALFEAKEEEESAPEEGRAKEREVRRARRECPIPIFQTEPILDRKSKFIGYSAVVHSAEDVQMVIDKLYEDPKIQVATHNMWAYRIEEERGGRAIINEDADSDGEDGASEKMTFLLNVMDEKESFVMVSRWWGGILLGPVRFKHIARMTEQALGLPGLCAQRTKPRKQRK